MLFNDHIESLTKSWLGCIMTVQILKAKGMKPRDLAYLFQARFYKQEKHSNPQTSQVGTCSSYTLTKSKSKNYDIRCSLLIYKHRDF